MLVRAFRLTDKLSNAFLKLSIFLMDSLLQRLHELRRAIQIMLLTVLGTFYALISGLLGFIKTTTGRLVDFLTRRGQVAYEFTEQRRRRIQETMVQRTREAEQKAREGHEGTVVSDPLLTRNRSLSAFSVILLFALIGVVLWATTESDSSGRNISGGIRVNIPTPLPGESGDTELNIPTVAPTLTPRSDILVNPNVSGTLVFTLRQRGQEDVWALPVGSNQAVRLTDSLQDDRDPAWSPDGTKIAFASRRDGPWDLYVLNLVEGTLTRLTFTPEYEGEPTWSPDGAFLAYEHYSSAASEGDNIDIYIISADGQQGPYQMTASPYPDLEPVWSPAGREIAYTGWRNGNREILIRNLDSGESEDRFVNFTSSPNINESAPAWSPDASRIAYVAEENGVEGIYVKSTVSLTDVPRLIGRGRVPTWNPADGSGIFHTIGESNNSALYLTQVDNFGVGAPAMAFEGLISDLSWANVQLDMAGFPPAIPPLYEESILENPDGKTGMVLLNEVDAPDPVLSDAVNDAFAAMRQRAIDEVGYDVLGTLESAFWRLERLPEPGQERNNWHYTGRAFSLNRDLIFAGNPTPVVIIRDDSELGTAWQVWARVAESQQDGSLGEPLRDIPWDFGARSTNAQSFEAGGRLMVQQPEGYYVNLTRLFADYGWQRVLADHTWRSNFSAVLYWQFEKRENLTWENAMLQIYTDQELRTFLLRATRIPATSIPTFTAAPPTGIPLETLTEVPSESGLTPVTALPTAVSTLPSPTPTEEN